MSEAFYSHARLYDLMFPGGGPAVDFYRADANRQGGRICTGIALLRLHQRPVRGRARARPSRYVVRASSPYAAWMSARHSPGPHADYHLAWARRDPADPGSAGRSESR